MPASLGSDGVRVHPGIPFGFLSETAFDFAGILTKYTLNLKPTRYPAVEVGVQEKAQRFRWCAASERERRHDHKTIGGSVSLRDGRFSRPGFGRARNAWQ